MEIESEKIEIKFARDIPESATFVVQDEDHTLGNALRYIMMKNPNVTIAGYSIPHPSDNVMNVRVQTIKGKSPVNEFKKGLQDLKDICDHMTEVFETESGMAALDMEED